MVSSGIIRRIDELGRIVIPKEIRKKLRIKTGDSLEIIVDDESIILNRYSQIENINDIIDSYTNAFNKVLKYNIIVTDTDKIIAISGNLKKKYLNLEIGSELEKIIERRDNVNSLKKTNIEISPGLNEEGYYTISPIICNGDSLGIVMIISLNNPLLPGDDKLATILSNILCNYFV